MQPDRVGPSPNLIVKEGSEINSAAVSCEPAGNVAHTADVVMRTTLIWRAASQPYLVFMLVAFSVLQRQHNVGAAMAPR